MSEVPPGWRRTTMGELGRYLNGRGFKKSEWGTVGRPIIRIQNLTGSSNVFNYFDGELDDRHVVRSGDLLVSWAATLGAYFWRGEEGALNQHIFKVESNIDARFHKYLLDYKLAELMQHTHGSGMVHVTRGRFDGLAVDIPELGEQRRIVDLLEDHFSRLDAGSTYLRSAHRRADSLGGQLLKTELERCPTTVRRLGELLESKLVNGKSVPTADEGFPVLRLTALRDGTVDLRQRKTGDWTQQTASRFLVQREDFLIARGNGSLDLVGRGGLVSVDPDPVAFPDTMIRARPNKEVLSPEFLNLVWNARSTRVQIEAAARTTAGIYKVNQRDLGEVVLPLPTLADQHSIVQSLIRSTTTLKRTIHEIEVAEARADVLRRTLLSAAFAGHLTGAASDLDRVEELVDA